MMRLNHWLAAGYGVFAMATCAGGSLPGLSSNSLANAGANAGSKAIAGAPELAAAHKKCDQVGGTNIAWDEEYNLGGAVAIKWLQSSNGAFVNVPATASLATLDGKTLTDTKAELTRYVNRVGRLVASQSSRPTLPWVFGVLDSQGINAFSAPGGYVFVTRGLLAKLSNEAQLAGVLAHEIAHVTDRHALLAYRKEKVSLCKNMATSKLGGEAFGAGMSGLADGLTGGVASSLPGVPGYIDMASSQISAQAIGKLVSSLDKVFSAGFPREQEFQADKDGLDLVIKAGYQPREFISLLKILPKGEGFFATHPMPADRAKALDTWVTELGKKQKDSFEYADAPAFASYAVVPKPAQLKFALNTP